MKQTLLIGLFVFAGLSPGCDDSKPAEKPKPIEASPAFRPLPEGTTFRASITSKSRLPEEPSKKDRKKKGQFRAVDTVTTVETTFYVELVEDRGKREKWRIDFQDFAKTRQRGDSATARTTHELPDSAFVIETAPEGEVTVEHKGGETVTDSQRQFVTAVLAGIRNRADWGEFLSSRKFPQGKIVEAPGGLLLGGFAEAFFGEVEEANTTVNLFRLGLVEGSEVGYFDVHSRRRFSGADADVDGYLDLEEKGRAAVRIVDGFVLEYSTDAKVVPRNEKGMMRSSGSGRWEMHYKVEADTLQIAD